MGSILQLIGGIIGLLANIPLFVGIYQDKIRQSFATYLLWGILDLITSVTIILQHGNYWLSVFYAFGALSIASLLMIKRQITWTWFETLVSALVSICVIVWYFEGERFALIASITSLLIASIPQIIQTLINPSLTPTGIYLVFSLASLLSFLGGKTFSLEEKLYPGTGLIMCLLIAFLSTRKSSLKIKTSIP